MNDVRIDLHFWHFFIKLQSLRFHTEGDKEAGYGYGARRVLLVVVSFVRTQDPFGNFT